MQYWPWWLGGLSLAAVVLLHWATLRRQMAVSGRFTALVNRWRHGPSDEAERAAAGLDQAALVRAMQAATAAEFGSLALDDPAEAPGDAPEASPMVLKAPQSAWLHATFLASLVLGGLVSALLAGHAGFSMSLGSEHFGRLFGSDGWLGPAMLVCGGVLVGFGTRMASGCTSGHGLCGVSRFQKGSLLATACFFAAGAGVSFALGALS